MADHSRVPHAIPAFNNYINTTDDRLQSANPDTGNSYFKDYGLDTADADDWKASRAAWRDKLYPAYTNAATSTSVVKDQVRKFMVDFRAFAAPLLNRIAVSKISGNAEEHIFNFILHRKNPTHSTTPIAAECVANMHGMGRGLYEIVCRSAKDASRSSKVTGADSIQFSYAISAQQTAASPSPEDAVMIKEIVTTTIFQHDFGAENQGKWLTIYFRWYNTKHPQLAGAWSAVQVMAIS